MKTTLRALFSLTLLFSVSSALARTPGQDVPVFIVNAPYEKPVDTNKKIADGCVSAVVGFAEAAALDQAGLLKPFIGDGQGMSPVSRMLTAVIAVAGVEAGRAIAKRISDRDDSENGWLKAVYLACGATGAALYVKAFVK
jgi:hypothetical protein